MYSITDKGIEALDNTSRGRRSLYLPEYEALSHLYSGLAPDFWLDDMADEFFGQRFGLKALVILDDLVRQGLVEVSK